MIYKNFVILFFVSCFAFDNLFCQTPTGSWTDHLVYSISMDIAVTPDEIFSSTGSSLLVYNKKYNELRKISTVNGLSEVGIAAISWSGALNMLVVGYSSTNIDLLEGSNVYNLPDIKNKVIDGNKTINAIKTNDKYAYLATDFGIVVIDLERREVHDTWRPAMKVDANRVFDVTFGEGKVFAATDNGVYYADLEQDGLAYFGNWQVITTLPQPYSRYNAIGFFNSVVYVNNSSGEGDNVYSISMDDYSSDLFYHESGLTVTSLEVSSDGMTLSALSKVFFYPVQGGEAEVISSYPEGKMYPAGTRYPAGTSYPSGVLSSMKAVVAEGDIWIADALTGLVRGSNLSEFSVLAVSSPSFASVEDITCSGELTVLTAGGVTSSWGNRGQTAGISIKRGNVWVSAVSEEHFDAMRTAVDPFDNSRIFVSTYGTGLLEYKFDNSGLQLVRDYRADNSPVEAITNGDTERVCGIAFDKKGNLWVTQPQVSSNIKMLKPDGTWTLFPNRVESSKIGDLLITSIGQKWLVLAGGNGLFVLDDNGTPDIFNDDRSRYLSVTDADGAVFNNVYCVAEDLDGTVWVGTDKGPMIYRDPSRIFDADARVTRLKIARDDGTNLADYMLGTETITSIAIDGGNRKWVGTENSGVYLLSADGESLTRRYNEENSPLFSNRIHSITINDITGDVWFATSKGLISVRGDATSGSKGFSNLFAFPNPVREDFQGDLTINGLERETSVRITDISGNLVYRTVSEGGTATWNLKTYNGKRVSTGVYLIFCANRDGSEAEVIKILVIN